MKKMVDNSKQVLNLYEMHETEVNEVRKKKRVLPIVLLILGTILIVTGYFYNDIFSFITDKKGKNDNSKIVENDNNKLRCNYNTSDVTLGISYTYRNNYIFDNEMLKKSTKLITITPIKNSDIADSNIKVLSGKYNDIIENLKNIDGITASIVLKENIITVKYSIDYSIIDLTKIPQNDLVVVSNKLNDSYRTIKKQNQELGYLCQ